MVRFISVVAALAVAETAVAAPLNWDWLHMFEGLNSAARWRGGLKYFGTATDNYELGDKPYLKQLLNIKDFGQLTPSNTQKWETIELQENVFNFTGGDELINFALRSGKMTRCHNLVWHSQLALSIIVEEKEWTNETLIAAMTNHVTNVARHFRGRCYAWDVVNEALNEDGTFRESVFYNTIGPAYIPIAFAAAAKADPFAKLYYNDYNLEWRSAKSEATVEIVRMIKAYGARIDGVGMQGHLILGSTPSTEEGKAVIKSYTDEGVETAYTELDIRMETPSNATALAQQSDEYYQTVKACVDSRGCVGVTIWDWTDKYSWIPGVFPTEGAALPWDENLEKKPAYDGILKALQRK